MAKATCKDGKKANSYSVLAKRGDFLAARNGVRVRGDNVRAEILARNPSDDLTPRAGITVTKKNGNAVMRNRIKRRLRDVLRRAGVDEMRAHHDYVIIAKPEAINAPFDALCADVQSVIKAAHKRLANP